MLGVNEGVSVSVMRFYASIRLASGFVRFTVAFNCSGDPSSHRIGGVDVALAKRFAVFQDGRAFPDKIWETICCVTPTSWANFFCVIFIANIINK